MAHHVITPTQMYGALHQVMDRGVAAIIGAADGLAAGLFILFGIPKFLSSSSCCESFDVKNWRFIPQDEKAKQSKKWVFPTLIYFVQFAIMIMAFYAARQSD